MTAPRPFADRDPVPSPGVLVALSAAAVLVGWVLTERAVRQAHRVVAGCSPAVRTNKDLP